jgi:hypothetical protein
LKAKGRLGKSGGSWRTMGISNRELKELNKRKKERQPAQVCISNRELKGMDMSA